MRTFERIVVDTNVFVSAVVLIECPPRRVLARVLADGIVLLSEDTTRELAEVLFRPKFDRYSGRKERDDFFNQLVAVAEFIPIVQVVRECRDPRDDKFLEVALNGRADVIVTGDGDLLAMNPWRGIVIVSPKDYLIVEV
ncbi:MAG TPA: putative toxin-antitoxin system toxin component, PIN family [Terriglobales bacterium]|nr:putative toxin-antitoxin system toxin component, PIN family [Terriglobales bacterium]